MVRIGAAQGASHLFDLVALDRVGTTMSNDTRRLIWEHHRWDENLGFQNHIPPGVLAIDHFTNLPLLLSHGRLRIYAYIIEKTEDAKK